MRSHPHFRREGRHIHQDLRLDFVDAILGADIRYTGGSLPLTQIDATQLHPYLPGCRRAGCRGASLLGWYTLQLDSVIASPFSATALLKALLQAEPAAVHGSVPLLEGSHMVTVRPGTQAGMRIRIPRQGVPSGSQRPGGDMFLNVIVELPKQVWDGFLLTLLSESAACCLEEVWLC